MSEIARLRISLNVDCPKCDDLIDILETDLNEEGDIIDAVIPSGNWISAHREFSCEVKCPNCNHKFSVEGVEW